MCLREVGFYDIFRKIKVPFGTLCLFTCPYITCFSITDHWCDLGWCMSTEILCHMKDDENAKAIALLAGVIARADAIEDIGARIEHLIKGVFSGNIFDLGAAQVLTWFFFPLSEGYFLREGSAFVAHSLSEGIVLSADVIFLEDTHVVLGFGWVWKASGDLWVYRFELSGQFWEVASSPLGFGWPGSFQTEMATQTLEKGIFICLLSSIEVYQ